MRTFKTSQFQLHARIVQHIRHGRAISRGALAEALQTSPSTMGLHVDELIENGYLVESGLSKVLTSGRPKRLLQLLPGAGWFAGVEFTGGRIQAARLNFAGVCGEVLVEPLPLNLHAAEVISRISEIVKKLHAKALGPLLGVGIGSPGFVDPVKGEVLFSNFQPDWKDVQLAAQLRRQFKAPIAVENNLHVITMAERWFGAARDAADYAIVRTRNGFGLGIVKNGQLVPGAHHGVGEIGLWPWPLDGGGGGVCVHEALSARSVWRRLSGADSRTHVPADLAAAMSKLAHVTGKVRDEVVTSYARVLGMTQLMIDSQLYFLHGPLTALGQRFCDEIMVRAVQLMPALRQSPVTLIPTALGEEAGALGAASLAMEAWNPEVFVG
jgi:predicted NBD/HSP70 family sugar kinase